jgi:hypothetical protein
MISLTNRAALVIRPTHAFTIWADSLDRQQRKLLEPTIAGKPSIYLVEPTKTDIPVEEQLLIGRIWREILELEFGVCSLVGVMPPPITAFEDFERFFNWQYVAVVADLSAAPLVKSGPDHELPAAT